MAFAKEVLDGKVGLGTWSVDRVGMTMGNYTCDICSQTLARSDIVFHTATTMQRAVRDGLNPWRTAGISESVSARLGSWFGLDSDEMYRHWRQRVMADTTDWGLCPACTQVVSRVASAATAPPESPSLWKQEADRLVVSGILGRFVAEKNGAWNHDGWLDFLVRVRTAGYTSLPDSEVGRLLEQEKAQFLAGVRTQPRPPQPQESATDVVQLRGWTDRTMGILLILTAILPLVGIIAGLVGLAKGAAKSQSLLLSLLGIGYFIMYIVASVGGLPFAAVVTAFLLLWPMRCPDCKATWPRFRKPQTREQVLSGGRTCLNCGCQFDRRGQKIGMTTQPSIQLLTHTADRKPTSASSPQQAPRRRIPSWLKWTGIVLGALIVAPFAALGYRNAAYFIGGLLVAVVAAVLVWRNWLGARTWLIARLGFLVRVRPGLLGFVTFVVLTGIWVGVLVAAPKSPSTPTPVPSAALSGGGQAPVVAAVATTATPTALPATAAPTKAPTEAPKPTSTPMPPTATPLTQKQRIQADMDLAWSKADWGTVIINLQSLRGIEPENQAWKEKLYAAYINEGDFLKDKSFFWEAVKSYEYAKALDPNRPEAVAKLAEIAPLRAADETKTAATAVAAKRSMSSLELLSLNGTHGNNGYAIVEGQVKNISNQSLKNVLVVVMWNTADGEFLESSNALVEFDPILPGQTTPFKVMIEDNPAMSRYTISFRTFSGSIIPTLDSVK